MVRNLSDSLYGLINDCSNEDIFELVPSSAGHCTNGANKPFSLYNIHFAVLRNVMEYCRTDLKER